ncbi:TlpA disulfide reductase family protein [Undibacterium cyanobacteriorum]|uniref:TlpA disulfide reductase family protein n=1 Tax=Undibacterium cyanobacteriorum TaxID=3073561 RepID=A0ABY9RED6_9BURK|nr:TlpA disulfide reductase family protein [Undibacterium sp. 20NA77.5]WMW79228.1 TlpA disulfide reductase family protein [Undibacterium sp. 20NA77.5]
MMKQIFIALLSTLSLQLFQSEALANTKVSTTSLNNIKLSGIDSKGQAFDLQNLQGKTILLTFYSAGCTACERDVKLMREFYRDNRQRNFMMVGVNLEKRKEDFDLYARIVNIATPINQQFQLIWKGSLKNFDGLGTIKTDPTHLVINRQGEVVLRREGMFKSEDWDFLWETIDAPTQ